MLITRKILILPVSGRAFPLPSRDEIDEIEPDLG
jgi:hypothetical protein